MGFASSKDPAAFDVATTGLGSTKFSTTGDAFASAQGAPFESQSIKLGGGRFTVAAQEGVCVSSSMGAKYTCKPVPFKVPNTGRYASSPVEGTIYVTAGRWPMGAAEPGVHQLTSQLRFARRSFAAGGGPTVGLERGFLERAGNGTAGYSAELWKSTDGGATWASLFSSEGEFYFNEIDCFDATHCVAVGEGFGHDGSSAPGARVYVTNDGKTFKLAHQHPIDGSSLMAANMLSATEHFAGGTGADVHGGLLALHSTDGGKTYANEGGGIKGQMITAMDFASSTSGYATTVNALQISSLLKYGSA